MYQDLLIATDGSESANRATAHGLTIADRFDATVHALAVAEELDHEDQMRTDAEGAAETAVEIVEDEAAQYDIPVTRSLRSGVPHEQILDYIREHAVDIVVMGTHGRAGFDRMVTGSVAEEVVRNSPVPVVTVRKTEDTE